MNPQTIITIAIIILALAVAWIIVRYNERDEFKDARKVK